MGKNRHEGRWGEKARDDLIDAFGKDAAGFLQTQSTRRGFLGGMLGAGAGVAASGLVKSNVNVEEVVAASREASFAVFRNIVDAGTRLGRLYSGRTFDTALPHLETLFSVRGAKDPDTGERIAYLDLAMPVASKIPDRRHIQPAVTVTATSSPMRQTIEVEAHIHRDGGQTELVEKPSASGTTVAEEPSPFYPPTLDDFRLFNFDSGFPPEYVPLTSEEMLRHVSSLIVDSRFAEVTQAPEDDGDALGDWFDHSRLRSAERGVNGWDIKILGSAPSNRRGYYTETIASATVEDSGDISYLVTRELKPQRTRLR